MVSQRAANIHNRLTGRWHGVFAKSHLPQECVCARCCAHGAAGRRAFDALGVKDTARRSFRKALQAEVGGLLGTMSRPVGRQPVREKAAAFAVEMDKEIRVAADGAEGIENHDSLDDNSSPFLAARRRGRWQRARSTPASCRPSDSWARARVSTNSEWAGVFVQRLRELGWIEGRTIAIEYRWGEGRDEQFAEIAAEFVRLKVDIIVTAGTPLALAAKQATTLIPIVFAAAGDPVERLQPPSRSAPQRSRDIARASFDRHAPPSQLVPGGSEIITYHERPITVHRDGHIAIAPSKRAEEDQAS
jgi:hypothetical protein